MHAPRRAEGTEISEDEHDDDAKEFLHEIYPTDNQRRTYKEARKKLLLQG